MADAVSLWQQLTAPENLWRAYTKARKGKTRRPDVAAFSLQVEMQLSDLRESLLNGSYQPAGYRQFYVHDRKPRLISSAPFRDRVLHHALIQVVEPIFEAEFSDCSWACRTGKGTHGAVQTYQRFAKRYAYVLKMDVANYFHSIDHGRLMHKLNILIKEAPVLELFQRIIDSLGSKHPKGLPIGNLTSQVLGNLYLTELDHFITQLLGYKAYVRYVDDMVVLSDNKTGLWDALELIQEKLADDKLSLHPKKVFITQTRCGLDFLGYRIFPRFIKLRHDNGYRFRQRLKQAVVKYRQDQINLCSIDASIQAWIGHAQHANSYGLRKSLFSEIVFSKGMAEQAVGSRRFVEQQTGELAFRQPEQEHGK